MSGLDVTIDARAALRAVIKSRYGRTISDGDWSTVTPSDDPPDGLGSQDTTDWQITLDRSSAKMEKQGYVMEVVSPTETEGARTSVLDDSVSLLVSKASGQGKSSLNLKIGREHMLFGLGAGLAAGALVMLGTAYRSSKDIAR